MKKSTFFLAGMAVVAALLTACNSPMQETTTLSGLDPARFDTSSTRSLSSCTL